MASVEFHSNLTMIQDRMARNFKATVDDLSKKGVEWVQYQLLYGYQDRHGPDGHTEIVDTGALFDSIKATAKRDSQNAYTVDVGTDKPYAVYVHEGTYKLKGRPFIRDALEKNEDKIQQIVADHAKDGF